MNSPNKIQHKLSDLIKDMDAVTIKGDPNCLISGVCTLHHAKPGHIAFLTNSLYRKYLTHTEAAAVILSEADAKACTVNAVVSKNPYFAYAKIAAFFEKRDAVAMGIHPSVVMGMDTEVDATAVIGANCVIGNHVKIAAHAVIGPGTIIGDEVEIAEAAHLDARVTVYAHVKIGKRTRIMSGAIIGSDGFGFANHKGTWHKVPQLGSVEIGDDVDVGANTTIDRGAVENTIIENGVKLDNLIQIAHNVKIGANTIIAGCVGIAGSAVIGKNCMIGGASMVAGHVNIADNVMITGGTGVSKSIREPGMYSSGIVGVVTNKEFRKNNAWFHRLGNFVERLKSLESIVNDRRERKE
jgi:UDP-3-O-[3-hydroxymyristoyl] glucosamine N-acyltransferase